jgi:hypothetical protein
MTFSISYKTYDKGAFNLIRFDGAEGSMIRQEDMAKSKIEPKKEEERKISFCLDFSISSQYIPVRASGIPV